MLIPEADLYLPIGEQMLHQIMDGDADNLEKVISGLDVPQIASLLLLNNLSEMKNTHPERFLAKNIDVLNSWLKEDGLASIRNKVGSVFNVKNIDVGYKLLPSFKIALLDEATIRERKYLTFEAKWDYSFNKRHTEKLMSPLVRITNERTGQTQILTSEQSRIYQVITAQSDEHMHVQGYAGTGKTSLVRGLIPILGRKGAQILILAELPKQIEAVMSEIGRMEHVFAKTFSALTYEIIPPDLTNHTNRYIRDAGSSRAVMLYDEIIKHFGIKPSGRFSPHFIAKVIRGTLAGFCYSGDCSIQLSHIPNQYAQIDETTTQVVLYYAEELWKETLNPTSKKDFKPPIRGYHRIKWVALNGWKIPGRYTHILIDECHNLSKSMLQILDCSPQAVISLGDEYQNLQGKPQRRSIKVRSREVAESVRSGRFIEDIVNPIIAIHPGKTKVPFQGRSLNTEIIYYAKPQVPDKPAAILVSSMWGLFEWAQRVISEDLNLHLLTDTENLKMFVSGCIDLYRNSVQSNHGELFRFKDWDEVASQYRNNQSFQKIDQMLRKGYQYTDWEKTSAKFIGNNPHSYLLGRIEDVRNHEFPAVMIVPEVISPVWQATSENKNIGAVGSAIYVAVTRAKQRLIAPAELRNWIEEISV